LDINTLDGLICFSDSACLLGTLYFF